jgi:hypothetical protein
MKYLREDLEAYKVMAGRSTIVWEESKMGWEAWFKGPDGITYSFLAESTGDTYQDDMWKLQLRRKAASNTEDIPDTKEMVESFSEAIMDWVNLRNPSSFFWIRSEKYESYNNIAKALSKKLKEYYFIDESILEEIKFDVIENAEENKYKRFIFTKTEPKAELKPEDWVEKKLDEFSKTTGVYEEPSEIKPDPDHTTPFNKNGKLDKGVDYKDKKLA